MKRINPDTGEIFKSGDVRKDGRIFVEYKTTQLKKDGTFVEQWLTKEALANRKEVREILRLKKVRFAKKNPGIKRLNPKTGKEFSLGEKENGKWFLQYNNRYVKLDGYVGELWGNWETYHRFKIKCLKVNAVYRANKEGYKSDLTIDYLLEIFPKDFMCPALGVKMEWGNKKGTRTSPSLDKIYPAKGYMKGNVTFISVKANAVKSDATPDEIAKVAKWLKKVSR